MASTRAAPTAKDHYITIRDMSKRKFRIFGKFFPVRAMQREWMGIEPTGGRVNDSPTALKAAVPTRRTDTPAADSIEARREIQG